jgi:DNA-binding transcriptional MerR regulator
MYTTKQVGAIFNRSHETIRSWAEEFQEHLEPLATPGRGKNRAFTEGDLEVLSLIAKMKDEGFNFEDIHRALQQGERGAPPNIKPQEAQLLVRTEGERRLMAMVEALQTQLLNTTTERDRAVQEASKVRELEKQLARTEAELEYLREQIEDKKFLHEQIGELKGELKAIKRQAGIE